MSSKTDEEKQTTCTDELNNMHIHDVCADCGKVGSDGLKACTACKLVKYCNRDCQIAHRSKHKKACRIRAAELHDEQLFKQPLKKDCPICFLLLPSLDTGSKFMACCGKIICSGCIYAPLYDNLGNIIGTGRGKKCPFCRTPMYTSNEEAIEMYKKRVEAGDAEAMYILGIHYSNGAIGLPQDRTRALELWHRAGEIGCADAYNNIGYAYRTGEGMERDNKKADNYFELAAMIGNVIARHNLGASEYEKSDWDRAFKHWLIAAGGGKNNSLKCIQHLYMDGHASKEDFAKSLKAYQKYLDEIKSELRDKAMAFDLYKYMD